MVWSFGDWRGLGVNDTPVGRYGSLISGRTTYLSLVWLCTHMALKFMLHQHGKVVMVGKKALNILRARAVAM